MRYSEKKFLPLTLFCFHFLLIRTFSCYHLWRFDVLDLGLVRIDCLRLQSYFSSGLLAELYY